MGYGPGVVGPFGNFNPAAVKLKKVNKNTNRATSGTYEKLYASNTNNNKNNSGSGSSSVSASSGTASKRRQQQEEKIPDGYTKEQVDSAWTDHVAPGSGLTYYHNSITKVSTYTKPTTAFD